MSQFNRRSLFIEGLVVSKYFALAIVLFALSLAVNSAEKQNGYFYTEPASASDASGTSLEIHYELFNSGKLIGTSVSRRKLVDSDKKTVFVETVSNIHIDSFWLKYDLLAKEYSNYVDSTLSSFNGEYIENNDVARLEASFSSKSAEIKGAGESKKSVLDKSIAHSDYEVTSEDAAWAFVKSGANEGMLAVLSIDNQEVEKTHFRRIGNEELTVAGKKLTCIKVAAKSKIRQYDLWLTEDATGFWTVKEEGKDSDGKYAVLAHKIQYSPFLEE